MTLNTTRTEMNNPNDTPLSFTGVAGLNLASSMPSWDEQTRIVTEIINKIEDALSNNDSGGSELDMIVDIARRIDDIPGFSGLSIFAQHAMMLNAERQANGLTIGSIQNFWTKLREEMDDQERKDARENTIQNGWQAVSEALSDRQAEQDRVRSEREMERVGNVNMSRADWGDLSNDIRNDQRTRNWFIEHFFRQGLTKDQAELKAKETGDLAVALAKPASERTPEDNAKINRGRNDPLITGAIEQHDEFRRRGVSMASPNSQAAALESNRTTSAVETANSFEGGIRSDVSLRTEFIKAKNSNTPLDAPPVAVTQRPQIAAVTAAPNADGFV